MNADQGQMGQNESPLRMNKGHDRNLVINYGCQSRKDIRHKSHAHACHPAGPVPKGEMYEEIKGANDSQFWNHHLAIGCHNQLKTWT
jgi:hypothetical protein